MNQKIKKFFNATGIGIVALLGYIFTGWTILLIFSIISLLGGLHRWEINEKKGGII